MDVNSKYKFIRRVGSGSFGIVSLFNTNVGLVCIKRIQMPAKTVEQNLIKSELYIISQVKHPNVIKFIDAFIKDNYINIVMEYAVNGTLRDFLRMESRSLTKKQIVKILCDLLMGLEYLHIRQVVHRDLKPENILIDQIGRMKIADFGISFIHAKKKTGTHLLGTPLYLAPELLKGNKCDFKADVWSLGCILFELCEKISPFAKAKDASSLYNILLNHSCRNVSCKSLSYGEDVQELCEKMLTFDPEKRASVASIITNHSIVLSCYNMYFKYNY